MNRAGKRAAWALAAALALVPGAARADAIDEFLLARDNFTAGEFAQAAVQLRRLVGVEPVLVPPALVEPARKYYAAALFSMGQRPQAEQVFEAILRDNPDAALAPSLFSPPLQSLFYDVRQRMLPVLNALRAARIEADEASRRRREAERAAQMALLRELATRETVSVRTSPVTALIPFGGAQMVNGQVGAGVAFLSAEVALAATAIGTYALCDALVVHDASDESGLAGRRCFASRPGYRDYPNMLAIAVSNVTAWSLFGATAVGGLVHAAVTFRGERREVRPRQPPPGFDRIQLAVVPAPERATLVLSGRF